MSSALFIVGVTGSRRGVSDEHLALVSRYVFERLNPKELHHGACLGVDAYMHRAALSRGIPVVAHPASDTGMWRMELPPEEGLTVCSEQEALIRNHDIVDACDILIVVPGGVAEVQRSGTWATYRYALRVNRAVLIVWPLRREGLSWECMTAWERLRRRYAEHGAREEGPLAQEGEEQW